MSLIRFCRAVIPLLPLAAVISPAESADKRYLIIHADDSGMSHSANIGTIRSMEKGIVSSTSMMVPCPWFTEFAEYCRNNPDRDYGIHLTLTSEWKHYRWGPVLPRSQVPSLVDEDGYLWHTAQQVGQHAKVEEVELELRAQIERAKKFGVPISHLDTHMGSLGSRADLTDLYVRIGIEYDIPVFLIRNPIPQMAEHYPGMAERGEALIKQLESARLPVVDYLAPPADGRSYEEFRNSCMDVLRDLRSGFTQIIIHCGIANEELRGITANAFRRDFEHRLFMDPKVVALVKELDIEVITWKQLRKLQE